METSKAPLYGTQALQHTVQVAVVLRAAVSLLCVLGLAVGLYGVIPLAILLVGSEAGLSYAVGSYAMRTLDRADAARRIPVCAVSGRCELLAQSEARNVLLRKTIKKDHEARLDALANSSAPEIRRILAGVGQN